MNVLVTGGSRGIGKGIVAELLKAGGTKKEALELFKEEFYHGKVKDMYPVDAMELNTGIMIGVIERELLQ